MTQQGDKLLQADLLRRKGMKQEARNLLVGYVQSNPDSSRAWWLLSLVLDDPKQQLDCVQRVLKSDPGNIEARNRLLQLQDEISAKPFVNPMQESSRAHPITAPFVADEKPAPKPPSPPAAQPFSSSPFFESSDDLNSSAEPSFFNDLQRSSSPFFAEDELTPPADSRSSSPFFPEDDLDAQPNVYRSASASSPFLPEDETLPPQQQSSLSAFERSFPAQNNSARMSDPPVKKEAPQSYSFAFDPELSREENYPEPSAYSYESEPAPKPTQPARAAGKKPAPKKNNDFVKYAVLIGAFLCIFTLIIIGFVFVLRSKSAVVTPPGPIIPTDTPTAISTQGLPPTWTPAPTFTLVPTSTLAYIESTPTPILSIVGTDDPNGDADVGIATGMQAPDFTLKNSNTGNQVSLSDFKGKPVVIFFWANGCGYCDAEASAMQDIYTQYKDAGLVVLAVDVWGDSDHARAYRDVHNLTYPMLIDPKGSTFKKYGGTNRFPVNCFVDANGNVSVNLLGMMDYSMLNMNVRRLLNLIPTVSP